MNPEDVRTVGIVGAGLMGHSIAQEYAVSGCRVALNDVSEERLGLCAGTHPAEPRNAGKVSGS